MLQASIRPAAKAVLRWPPPFTKIVNPTATLEALLSQFSERTRVISLLRVVVFQLLCRYRQRNNPPHQSIAAKFGVGLNFNLGRIRND
jgi:hypothetical protein